MSDNIYKTMFDQTTPGADLINRTKARMNALAEGGTSAPRFAFGKLAPKPLLIAGVLIAMLSTTAFVYGEGLVTFMFGNSVAKRLDVEEGTVVFEWLASSRVFLIRSSSTGPYNEIVNRSVPNMDWTWEEAATWNELTDPILDFRTFDDLRQTAPFAVKELSSLPDGWKLERTGQFLYRDGTYAYDTQAYYRKYYEYSPLLIFYQSYAGLDAYFEVCLTDDFEEQDYTQTSRHETVMVGEEEGLLSRTILVRNNHGLFNSGMAGTTLTSIDLRWMKDEIAYRLSITYYHYTYHPAFDWDAAIDMLITIAESV